MFIYIFSISISCGSPVEIAVIYARIDNLLVHLGYKGTNND